MEKVYIKTNNGKNPHAGSKARDDVDTLLNQLDYRPIVIGNHEPPEDHQEGLTEKVCRHFLYGVNALRLDWLLPKDSIVVMQHPVTGGNYLRKTMKAIKKHRHLKLIAVIHDLDSLRELHAKKKQDQQTDLELLSLCDGIICHNQKMKNYLIEQGFQAEKIVSLELFDYLTLDLKDAYQKACGIVIAGNLNQEKAGYLRQLADISEGIPFQLYGPNFSQAEVSGLMEYHGSFSPAELNEVIKGEFGLIWDGPDARVCAGNYGAYLRYNNSHKASFYLSVGLPLIVWQESALAEFVLKNQLGIAVASLTDIPEAIAEMDYVSVRENVLQMQKKVTEGFFLKQAMKKVEEKL